MTIDPHFVRAPWYNNFVKAFLMAMLMLHSALLCHCPSGLSWSNIRIKLLGIIGPSGVRALPLAAGINEGGNYFKVFFLFLLPLLFKTTEGVVVGFQIFAWAPKKK